MIGVDIDHPISEKSENFYRKCLTSHVFHRLSCITLEFYSGIRIELAEEDRCVCPQREGLSGQAERVEMNFIVLEFGTYGRAIFFDRKTRISPAKVNRIRFSPEYIRMAELVHELDFLEHIWPVRRQLIHLEHHHLTRHFMSNLEKRSEHRGLAACYGMQPRSAAIDIRSCDRCIVRNRSDSLRYEFYRGHQRRFSTLFRDVIKSPLKYRPSDVFAELIYRNKDQAR